MIISKAIEILNININETDTHKPQDYLDALKLGKEALKRIEYARFHPFKPVYLPLPGETMPERGIQAGMQSRQAKKTKRA